MAPFEGVRLAQAIADILARKDHDVAGHVADVHHAVKHRYVHEFMEQGEEVLGPHVADLTQRIREHPALPEEIKRVFEAATGPSEQFEWLLQLAVMFVGVFSWTGALTGPLIQNEVNAFWASEQSMPLTPAELALMVVKGIRDQGDAADQAAMSGLDAHRFDGLVQATGNPPGPAELMFALRRGLIDQGTFAHGIRQSHIRDEWLGTMLAIAYGPPSAAEAIAGAVEGHLDLASAAAIVAENGIAPDHFMWMYETAGRPPGTEQMLQLLNRGVVSEGDVVAAIRESDVKNKYTTAVLQMRVHLPPMRTVIAMVRKGVLSAGEGTSKLLQLGFSASDAAAMIREASTDATQTHKNLSESLIVRGYKDGLIDRGAAAARLSALLYDASEVDFILQVADLENTHGASTQAVGHVRSMYVSHRIDKNRASADLDALGVTATTRDAKLREWDIERAEVVAELTPTQLASMFKKGLITEADYRARLTRHGYTAIDIDLLVQLNHPAQVTP